MDPQEDIKVPFEAEEPVKTSKKRTTQKEVTLRVLINEARETRITPHTILKNGQTAGEFALRYLHKQTQYVRPHKKTIRKKPVILDDEQEEKTKKVITKKEKEDDDSELTEDDPGFQQQLSKKRKKCHPVE